jgi:hypothetical protein
LKYVEELEGLLRDERLAEESHSTLAYQNAWIEYAGLVRDSRLIYEQMERKGIGQHEAAFFVSFALYFEKYERDFKRAEELYLKGLAAVKGALRDIVLQKFKEFGARMQKRTQRDVLSQLPPTDLHY